MKILFVSREKSGSGISPIVMAQINALKKKSVKIDVFPVQGVGHFSYIRSIPLLRNKIRRNGYDMIHAHYSYCGIISRFATKRAIVVSLMGSDVKKSGTWRHVLRIFANRIWSATIVKSEDMKKSLGLDCVHVIPNGVDINVFKPMDRLDCRKKVNWPRDKCIVLFAADPSRHEKNYALAEHSIRGLKNENVEMKVVHHVDHIAMPVYINASDIVLLTSLWEGSPNVVKEAMACNKKVVTTDVGDVRLLLDNVPGSYIVQSDPDSVIHGIMQAIDCEDSISSRERLRELGLDSNSVSDRIVRLYQDVVGMRNHG